MENTIKEHIDKLSKKRLTDAVDRELSRIKDSSNEEIQGKAEKQLKDKIRKTLKEKMEKGYAPDIWLYEILSQDLQNSCFPSNEKENDLFQLLTLEVSYKRTFKSACDDEHPIIIELLEDLQIEKDLIQECVTKTKAHNPEPLSFYLLFQEELENAKLSLDGVHKTIDKLSQDSKHGAIVSHPSKMSNPECKFPKLFVTADSSPDGFVRTGNSNVVFDMHINATYLKVFKFISLLYRGIPLLEYIITGAHQVFIDLFKVNEDKARDWIEQFSICLKNEDRRTNKHIRQIYFPVNDNYHLLSLLTPSGMVFSLKEQIDQMNDRSPAVYLGKKKKKDNKYAECVFSTIPNLTVIRHGGEHPKNICGLNNKYQTYYLLNSAPPTLQKRHIHFPRQNFFKNSFYAYEYREVFDALHRLFKTNYNNINIREGRDYRLQDLMERIIDKMWSVRAVAAEQYRPKYSQLKPHQEIWLCEEHIQTREVEDEWLNKLCQEISAWTIRTYEKLLGKQACKLGEDERQHILKIINQNREALR